jgi:hypothetical protein
MVMLVCAVSVESRVLDPPISYWCSEYVSGGGATQFMLPSGFIVNASAVLPNAPYKDTSRMIANVYHPYLWENWSVALRFWRLAEVMSEQDV